MIKHLLYLNDLNWRGNIYQWFFYFGILLTLIFEKRKMLRIVFGWVPFFYLVSIFNPITLKLLSLAGLHNDAYFTRLFSFMPLMYVIAYGFSTLLRILLRIRNGWLKMLGVGVICAVICLTGHNIYQESWFTKAENYEKIPLDTLEIVDAIKDDGLARIALIDANTVYIRQTADVITPYGRYMGELGSQLSVDPPDVRLVMEMAGEQDIDYIVTHKVDETIAAFYESGYEPYAMTRNYAVFKVGGVNRFRRELNEKRQVVTSTYYNASGEREKTSSGYCFVRYDYDSQGRWIKISYFDTAGKYFYFDEGYTSVKRSCYLNGNVKQISYLDGDDRPVLFNGCYETKYDYNVWGQIIRESYYDQDGAPMSNRISHCCIKEIEYTSSGKIKGDRYLDANGNPMLSAWGFARRSREYDEQGQIISEVYYGIDGKEVCRAGIDEQEETLMDKVFWCSDNAKKKDNRVAFTTAKNENRFNATQFQLHDPNTGEFLLSFGYADSCCTINGEYHHELPSGVYELVFKGNTNLKDEFLSCLVYLVDGEVMYYKYSIKELQEKRVIVDDYYIGKVKMQGI